MALHSCLPTQLRESTSSSSSLLADTVVVPQLETFSGSRGGGGGGGVIYSDHSPLGCIPEMFSIPQSCVQLFIELSLRTSSPP